MASVVCLGIDLVDLERVRNLCQNGNRSFAERICTQAEIDYCFKRRDPVPSLAARFAVKEAVSKALGTGIGASCAFKDVEVISSPIGVPILSLSGAAAKTAAELGIESWKLSITHSQLSAAAVVIGLGGND